MGQGDSDYYLQEPGRLALLSHLAEDPVGHPLDQAAVLDYLERDANFLGKNRDTSAQPYGLPNHNNNKGRRWTPRDLVKDTPPRSSSTTPPPPHPELLAWSISPERASTALHGNTTPAPHQKGTLKRAFARKEVIISGGVFNSPQLLQLSGIGNATLLQSLGIPVIVDLPGVGENLRDNQELPVAGLSPVNITSLPGDLVWANCTYGAPGDPCLAQWQNGTGPYTLPSGNSECSFLKTGHSPDGNRDVITFAPPGVFRGFSPPASNTPFLDRPSTLWRSLAHMPEQNSAGYVRITSTDPTVPPEINILQYESPRWKGRSRLRRHGGRGGLGAAEPPLAAGAVGACCADGAAV
ncbi:hypothetical protein DL546_002687 [Coniochaeta pulveracea]|uniref:Glucose-methanol-choline oxidoreductase N-terminal domain-containing protein n=1 Tax=Coniochaeta pulveracea TaxID=177199 RepID=A0A420Y9U1_9PEZI|nr:hypothetical protein DL546_002687 [Coniochaeta pulveracea]